LTLFFLFNETDNPTGQGQLLFLCLEVYEVGQSLAEIGFDTFGGHCDLYTGLLQAVVNAFRTISLKIFPENFSRDQGYGGGVGFFLGGMGVRFGCEFLGRGRGGRKPQNPPDKFSQKIPSESTKKCATAGACGRPSNMHAGGLAAMAPPQFSSTKRFAEFFRRSAFLLMNF
jgi:hypothetical protein